MVIAAVSIIPQGKNVDISWSPHLAGTLNLMAFLLLLFFVLAYSTKATFRGLVVRQIAVKGEVANKILRSYPTKPLSQYQD